MIKLIYFIHVFETRQEHKLKFYCNSKLVIVSESFQGDTFNNIRYS